MNNPRELQFSKLLDTVISKWPDLIDTSAITINEHKPERYETVGLYELSEEISENFETEELAILLVPLCDTVFSVIRSASLFCTTISPKTLRPETIQKRFEERLLYIIGEPKLGWEADELEIAKQYLNQSIPE